MSQPTNFLTLAQKVHELSGMGGSGPSAVTSQSGYNLKIVNWTNEAWYMLQGMFEKWRFMRTSITKTLTVGTSNYDITASPFSLTDFGRWDENSFTVNTSGDTDKTRVTFRDYPKFQAVYETATFASGRPTAWTNPSAETLQFNAALDIAYILSARYYRAPSNMSADTDAPTGLPKRFYMLIVYEALKTLAIDRGTNELLIEANFKAADLLGKLMSAELEVEGTTTYSPLVTA